MGLPSHPPQATEREHKVKWSIVLQLTPEVSYILTHSRLPDAVPNAQPPPLTLPEEDNPGALLPEDDDGNPPPAATVHRPHRLPKRHLPHDQHFTNNRRGRCTLPLQWASPESTFTGGEVPPGSTALT